MTNKKAIAENSTPKIIRFLTAQGIQVLFTRRPELPIVTVSVHFNAGSVFDHHNYGLSSLTNMLLKSGSKGIPYETLEPTLDAVGAGIEVNSNRDVASITLVSLSQAQYFKPALDTLLEILTEPAFLQKDIDRMQQLVLNALSQQQHTPEIIARNTFYEAIYDRFPYGRPVLGTIKSVANINRAQIKLFYKQHYNAKNAVLTVVGDLTTQDVHRIADIISLALLPGTALLKLPPFPQRDNSGKQIKVSFASDQAYIIMGKALEVGFADPNYLPLMVGNNILGSAPLSSRLFSELRGKYGLVYTISSDVNVLKQCGQFIVLYQCKAADATNALQLTYEVIADFLVKGPSSKELRFAKQRLINSFPLSLSSNQDVDVCLQKIGCYHQPKDFIKHYQARVNALTKGQIIDAFRQTLSLDELATVVVGPN